MPQIFEVELSDGRIVEVESGEQPTEEQLRAALGSWQQPEAQSTPLEAPSWFSAPQSPAEFGSSAFSGQVQAIAQNPFASPAVANLGQAPDLEIPEDNGKGRLRSAGASFMQGGGVGIGTALSGFTRLLDAGAAESLQEAAASTGNRELFKMAEQVRSRTPEQKEADLARDSIYKAGQELAVGAREAFVPNPKFKGEFWTDIMPSAGGQMVPTVAAGIINPTLAAAQYGLSSGQQGAEESIAAGDIADADRVFFTYLGLGGLSEFALGVPANILRYVQAARKAGVGKEAARNAILKAIGKGGVREAGQESLEQIGQNITAQQTFDPNRKTLEGVPESVAAGFLLGGGAAGVAAGVGRETLTTKGNQNEAQSQVQLQTQQSQISGPSQVQGQPSAGVQEQQESRAEITPARQEVAKIEEATGFTESPGFSTEGMTKEQAAQMADQPWHFTDQRADSPTRSMSVSVPKGSTLADVEAAIAQKREQGFTTPEMPSVNAQPKETVPPTGEPASISGGTSPAAAPEVGNIVSLDPSSGSALSGMDSLINRLESLKFKADKNGKVISGKATQVFSLPHPDMVYAVGAQVWNDTLDLAVAGLNAGKALAVVIEDAMANIRTKSTGPYDEAQARANLESALTEKPDTAAPGAKTRESGGQFFSGENPQETATMMQDRAASFLQGKADQQAIEDLVRLAGGDTSVQLDNQAANFVIKDLLVRASDRAHKTKNPVEAVEAWSQVDRLAELSRRLGAEDARSLVSRKLAYRQIDWLMPVLAWRGIVKDRWRKALGIPEGQPLNESVITPEEAKKRGLPELNGEQTEKIAKLSKEAEKLPQGVRRNRVMDQMVKEIQNAVPISKLGLLRDIWYASVLMRVGTFINVLAGSYSTGASFTAMAALDRTVRLKPLEAMKIVGQFIGGTIEGTLIAKEVAQKGAWHLLPDAELRFSNLLSGKAGARFDNLEALLRRKNPIGVLAYTRRFMSALDYIGAEGTRDAQVLYAALTRGDQESLDALDRRFDREQNRRAGEQARAEMGAEASRAEVLVRKREILEEGVSEELKEAAINTARRAAQNANPRGIPGIIYQGASKLPFWVRAPTGLAFIRAGMNMVQNAIDYMPGIGAIQATSGMLGTLPEKHPLKRFGMDIPIEERRMMWAAQGASLGIAAIAAAMFLGDDEDEGMEISGSWRGLDAKKRSQLMELGERPNSIRFGKKGPWISFKQMPFAPPLAIVGTARDEERFHGAEWNGESFGSKLTTAWLAGLLYVRDLSALSGVAAMFDGNAWNTQENPTKLAEQLSRWGAQSVGRATAGYIPSIIKEIDEFGDQSLYRPGKDELMGYWIRNIPYARRTVGEGPALNNFGEPIQLTPPPIKSWAGFGKDDELYKMLGSLASKGIFIPEPDRSAKVVDKKGDRRSLTDAEWYRFIKVRGGLLKKSFTTEAEFKNLTSYSPEDAAEYLKSAADEARNGALDLIKY